jgi:hypothetical protein
MCVITGTAGPFDRRWRQLMPRARPTLCRYH